MSRGQKPSLGLGQFCGLDRQRIQKKSREVAVGEAGRELGSWAHSPQEIVKPNTLCTVAAGVT